MVNNISIFVSRFSDFSLLVTAKATVKMSEVAIQARDSNNIKKDNMNEYIINDKGSLSLTTYAY
jgi:hypothetical protein